jgi:hypothetical protein
MDWCPRLEQFGCYAVPKAMDSDMNPLLSLDPKFCDRAVDSVLHHIV